MMLSTRLIVAFEEHAADELDLVILKRGYHQQ